MIKDRLDNWARYVRSSRREPISCRSLESKYKPPPCWHPPILNVKVDILDAWEVEKAIVQLDERDKKIIVYAYAYPYRHFDAFCSKMKIHGTKHMSKSEAFALMQLEAERRLDILLNEIKNAA